MASGFISSAGPVSLTYVVRADAAGEAAFRLNAARAESDGWCINWFAIELSAGSAR